MHELPVENRGNPPVSFEEIAEPVVAMHERQALGAVGALRAQPLQARDAPSDGGASAQRRKRASQSSICRWRRVLERHAFAPFCKRRRAPVKTMQRRQRADEVGRERFPPRALDRLALRAPRQRACRPRPSRSGRRARRGSLDRRSRDRRAARERRSPPARSAIRIPALRYRARTARKAGRCEGSLRSRPGKPESETAQVIQEKPAGNFVTPFDRDGSPGGRAEIVAEPLARDARPSRTPGRLPTPLQGAPSPNILALATRRPGSAAF